DPWLLQGKVSVFVDLYRKTRQLEAQAELLNQRLRERQEAERKLGRQADALRRANAELEQFGALASRDLAVPLHNVRGYVQLLLLDHADALNDDARDLLDRVGRGIDTM